MTEELRYLTMKKAAWEEIIKPAIEKHFHIEGLSGKYEELPIAPPKDWQERLHKVAELTQYISETGDGTEAGFNSIDVAISRLKDAATLKLQIIELGDANHHLAKVNDKLMAEKKKNTAWLDQALNEGDGVYRP